MSVKYIRILISSFAYEDVIISKKHIRKITIYLVNLSNVKVYFFTQNLWISFVNTRCFSYSNLFSLFLPWKGGPYSVRGFSKREWMTTCKNINNPSKLWSKAFLSVLISTKICSHRNSGTWAFGICGRSKAVIS